jgi:PAS domain S-box-containing protein
MAHESTVNLPHGVGARGARAIGLTIRVLLVGLICYLSTEVGFAHKVPPHNISALWPTGAILFSVLVVTPVRHWLAYTVAAYFGSVINDVRAGFPVAAIFFIAAGIIQILIAAIGVRRLADGPRAFDTLRGLVAYISFAVFLGPFVSAFIGALAGGTEDYWFYWRVWFLSEALALLMLAPAILTWMEAARGAHGNASVGRLIEAVLIVCGLLAISTRVFVWPVEEVGSVPALVYLPLPFMLWAAVRFGPIGVNTCLLIVAFLSISGAVHGRGPFATTTPAENVLELQLFLVALSLPLMFLSTLLAERRASVNHLRESEARFRTMANTAPVMVWMSGVDKLCTFFNKGWLDFTGRTLPQELGNGWAEAVHQEDFDRCVQTYTDNFDARRPFTMEYRLRRFDGEYRWVLDTGVPRSEPDGAFLGYIGTAIDITESKLAERELAEQRSELAHLSRVSALGQLSASIAHQLNQPLAAILSNAEAAQKMLGREPVDFAELREICSDIVAEDHRAAEVISRLSALFKRGDMPIQPLDVNELIRETLALLHTELVMRHVTVSTDLAPSLPVVEAGRVQLQQVLLNLIVNAIDAMAQSAESGRTLVIRTDVTGGEVRICISDRGPGIAAAELKHIFEPFWSSKPGGMGMGLAICRSIIAAHHGSLTAVNNPEGGVTFCATLPERTQA